MKQSDGKGLSLLSILLIFVSVVLATLLVKTRPWLLMILLLCALTIGSVFYLIKSLNDHRKKRAFAKSIGGNVMSKLEQCDFQIEKNKKEIEEIKHSLRDLDSKLDPSLKLKDTTQKETERIRSAFQKELKLRQAKISFYETCRTKLRTLEYNHRMVKELALKQEKLNKLQEEHFEEIADMESLKSGVEHDQFYLDSIEKLSLKMSKSTSLDAAEGLQLELVEITKELRRI
ncbi:MAG: hypothetical protein AAF985_05430 [Bacteroidota bacterium]